MQSEYATNLNPQNELYRYQALLDLADLMVRHYSLSELFHEIAVRLQRVAEFQLLHFGLHDPKENVMRRHLWEGEGPVVPEVVSLGDSASGYVWENQAPLMIRDLNEDQRFPQVFGPLREKGFRTYYVFPLTTAQSRLGALGVGSRKADAYGQQDLELLIRVAELVAIAVETALTKNALLEERRRLQALVDVNRELVSSLEMQRLLPLISECVTRVVPHDFAGVTIYEDDQKAMKAFVLSPSDARPVVEMGRTVHLEQTLSAQAFLEQRPQLLTRSDLSALTAPIATRMLDAGIQTVLCMPMVTSKGAVGTLNVGSKRDRAFSAEDAELLNQIAAQLAIALENARAYREIQALKERLSEEKLYLEGEIRTELHFEEIVGESAELKKVLNQAKTVAPSGSTALILGETGTGKELIARAIHRMSKRKDANFIKVNCAAIPTGLLESELFGHEKGAFTGAISQKIGRIELAHQGTLFLDEIGDIPLELQPKLLRLLQDQEFERLGGIKTIRVDVRLLAATNRDLSKDVGAGEFRSDLFYRLNVFPIRLPPLRDRAQRHPAAGAVLRAKTRKANGQSYRDHSKCDDGRIDELELAGKCTGVGKLHRTFRNPDRGEGLAGAARGITSPGRRGWGGGYFAAGSRARLHHPRLAGMWRGGIRITGRCRQIGFEENHSAVKDAEAQYSAQRLSRSVEVVTSQGTKHVCRIVVDPDVPSSNRRLTMVTQPASQSPAL